jgi:hypothetical protein
MAESADDSPIIPLSPAAIAAGKSGDGQEITGTQEITDTLVYTEPMQFDSGGGWISDLEFMTGTLPTVDTPDAVTITRPPMWLAIAGADNAVRRWNVFDLNSVPATAHGHESAPVAVLFGANPDLVFALAKDGTVRTWVLDKLAAPSSLPELMENLGMWRREACLRAGRDFNFEERKEYFHKQDFQSSCSAVSEFESKVTSHTQAKEVSK